ncbi:MAG: DNA-binding protein [Marmoricola sp.]|nr:DNA-binding protein [Marmoricola sp.]
MSLPPARRQGVLVRWDDARGFGFLEPGDGGPRVFVHVSAFPRGRRPVRGCPVAYVEARDAGGRPRAVEARLLRGGTVRGRHARGVLTSLGAVLLLGVALTALLLAGRVPALVAYAYLATSVLTAGAYGVDKAAAQQGAWRTRESTLHLLALLGGWPGALLARQAWHHKTVKQPFVTVLWLTVALNGAALAAYALRPG